MTISLKRRLQAGFGVVIALAAFSSLVTIVELGAIRNTERRIAEVRFPAVLASERIGQGMVEASLAYRNYIIYGDNPELAAKHEKSRQEGWSKVLSQIENLKALGEQKELALLIERDVRDGNIRIQDETRFDIVGKGPEARQRAMDRMKAGSNFVAKTNGDCAELSKRVRESLVDDQKQVASAELLATRTTILCVVLCAIFGISFGQSVITRITGGIDRVVERTHAIAAGNLTTSGNKAHNDDEIGTALTSIDEMQNSLAKTIMGVIDSAKQLATACEELSSSSSSIARSTAEQSSQTEHVATAMNEMSSTVCEISENSRTASDMAESAGVSAREGGKIVESMVVVITGLADSTKETASKIEQLGKSSDQIGKIVGVIDEIADQTNLLALNAAIEAARAGEQGRGFAVVADEVRKLAERTSSATREIGDMIKMIQDETRNAVQAMHAGTGKVEEGVRSSRCAGDSLAKIIESAASVQRMVTQIATAAREQAATTEEVTGNLQKIASMVQESATGASNSAKSSEDLSNLALQLRELVEGFQIDGINGEQRHNDKRKTPRPSIGGYEGFGSQRSLGRTQ